jgi:uncharacterized membrane protein
MAFLLLTLGSASSESRDKTTYAAIPIESRPGVVGCSPTALNEKCHVIGIATEKEDWSMRTGYFWSGGRTIGLPSLPLEQGFERYPMGLNNRDEVVGMDSLGTPTAMTMQAWYWEHGGKDLLTLSPLRSSDGWVGARMINEAGRIVGFSGPVVGEAEDAVFWESCQFAPVRLKTLPSLPAMTGALGLNNNDPPQIFGWCGDTFDDQVALVWSGPQAAPNWLPGIAGGRRTIPCCLNDYGLVAGWSMDADGRAHGVVWPKGELLPLAPAFSESAVNGLNNRGQIVGFIVGQGGAAHAALWEVSGRKVRTIDLNDRVTGMKSIVLTYANGINDDGWIIADGVDPNGTTRSYLLAPLHGR